MLFVNVDIPEAFTPTTDMLGVPVNPADVPVVSWFNVGILALLIVPDEILDAFKLVKLAPDPSESSNVPAEFGKTTVGFPEKEECAGACNL